VEFSEATGKSQFYFVPVERLAEAEPIGDLRYCRGIGELIQFDYERISSGATPVLASSSTDPATGEAVSQPKPANQPPLEVPPPDTDRNLSAAQKASVQDLAELAAVAASKLKQPQGRLTGQAGDPDAAKAKIKPDPTRVVGPPERMPAVPYLDFSPLDNVLVRLEKLARAYDASLAALPGGPASLADERRDRLNGLLRGMEQALTDARGLPGRDWYRHLIYAPGLLTGYGAKTLPGVREAIEDDRWDEANRYLSITATALSGYSDRLDEAVQLLREAGGKSGE